MVENTRIKGAIFDKDGILFNTEVFYNEAWKLAGKDFGLDVSDAFCLKMKGRSKHAIIELIQQTFPSVDPYKMRESCFKHVKRMMEENLELKPGVVEVLQYLKTRGYKTAVASSATREQIYDNLERGKILHYFDVVVAGFDIDKSKPEPDIFLKACRQLALKPEECYVFEDSPLGIQAGHAAGCYTILIPDLFEPKDQPYDEVCKDFFEVMEKIEKNEI